MSKVPVNPQFKPSSNSKMIVCWEPGATEAEKQQDMVELEKYMAYRIARAKKSKASPIPSEVQNG